MLEIKLREVPYDRTDEDSITWIGMGTDRSFEIVLNGTYTIGLLYVAEDFETSNGLPCKTYITWLELASVYRGRHLLRSVMQAIHDVFGEVYLESPEQHRDKYSRIGAMSLGVDEVTGNEIFKYSVAIPHPYPEFPVYQI